MKHQLSLVLAVALVIDLAAFFGVGFGTGSLCTAGTAGCTPGGTLSQTSAGPGGITFQIALSGMDGNGVYTSAYNTGGNSTPITFQLKDWVANNSCSQSPGWEVGSSYDYGWYQVFVTMSGTLVPLSLAGTSGTFTPGPSNGQGTYSYYVVSQNSSSAIQSAYCYGGSTSTVGGLYPVAQGQSLLLGPFSFTLSGTYEDFSIVHIRFFTEARYCNAAPNPFGGDPPQCHLGNQANGQSGSPWQGYAEAQEFLRSGYSALIPQQGVAYNGGTLSVPYSTGYDGGAGYTATFQYGPCRSNAGQTIQSVSLPQTTLGVAVFNVPNNLAVLTNVTCPAPYTYNEFTVVLFSGQFPLAWSPRELVDVSPSTAPGVPQISLVDVSGHPSAQVGDTIVLTFNATYTAAGGKISTFNVAGYYSVPGVPTPPISSTYWIGGNAQGSVVNAVCTGNVSSGTCSGTYRFQLTYLADVTVTVQAITTLNQGNQNVVTLQVNPGGCSTTSCRLGGSGVWQVVGPVTLVLAFVVGVSLLAFWAPLAVQYRVLMIGATVVVLAALYGTIATWFVPGGPL